MPFTKTLFNTFSHVCRTSTALMCIFHVRFDPIKEVVTALTSWGNLGFIDLANVCLWQTAGPDNWLSGMVETK